MDHFDHQATAGCITAAMLKAARDLLAKPRPRVTFGEVYEQVRREYEERWGKVEEQHAN